MCFPPGEGDTVFLSFLISMPGLDIEVLSCVNCLDKVVLLVHCCILGIYCAQANPVSHRTLGIWQFEPWMNGWMMFLNQIACDRGWNPLPNLLPSPLSKLLNLVPNPQAGVQPNPLPSWQPSLRLERPFQWPLFSICSSSKSSIRARKSGTQCLFLSRPEHTSHRSIS